MDFEEIKVYAERTAGIVDQGRISGIDFGLMVDLLEQEVAIIKDMLGTEGENTDYAAHLAGLACGLALGAFEAWRVRNHHTGLGQWSAAAATFFVVCVAWWRAFAAITG